MLLGLQARMEQPAVSKKTTLLLKELATWAVADYEDNIFRGLTLQQFATHFVSKLPAKPMRHPRPTIQAQAHETFDPRKSQFHCTRGVMNQGSCGSCWAVSVADAFTDRVCVAKHKLEGRGFSSQYLVSCDDGNYGCKGGHLSVGWLFVMNTGLVSEECFPYSSVYGTAPICPTKCVDGKELTFQKCKADSVKELSYYADQIMKELKENGSLAMTMVVNEDFIYYKGGVYRYVYGKRDIGRHAVRCTGYGVQDGTSYWLCANSWGTTWGEAGWFRIAFGEAEIESDVWGCTPE